MIPLTSRLRSDEEARCRGREWLRKGGVEEERFRGEED